MAATMSLLGTKCCQGLFWFLAMELSLAGEMVNLLAAYWFGPRSGVWQGHVLCTVATGMCRYLDRCLAVAICFHLGHQAG